LRSLRQFSFRAIFVVIFTVFVVVRRRLIVIFVVVCRHVASNIDFVSSGEIGRLVAGKEYVKDAGVFHTVGRTIEAASSRGVGRACAR
jgi:hypothetical protein